MRAGETTGCCAAANLYNVGGAHGHKTANSQEEFELWISKLTPNDINYSLTNEDQEQTRGYMKKAGFDIYGPYDYIYISVISGENFRKIQERVNKRTQEDRLNKEAARIKAQEERKERESKLKFSSSLNPNVFSEMVREEEIRGLCGGQQPYMIVRGENRRTNTRRAIEEKYKIQLPNGWWDQNSTDLRQMVYDLVYKARKTAGIL